MSDSINGFLYVEAPGPSTSPFDPPPSATGGSGTSPYNSTGNGTPPASNGGSSGGGASAGPRGTPIAVTTTNEDPVNGRVAPDTRIMFYLNNGRYDVTDTPGNLLKNIGRLVADNKDGGKEGSSSPGSLVLTNSQGGTYVVAFHNWPDLQNYLNRSAQPLPAAPAPAPVPTPAPLPSASTVSDSMLAALWQSDLGVAPTAGDLASMRTMANAGYTINDVRTTIAASTQAITATAALYQTVTGSVASPATIQALEQQLAQPGQTLDSLRAGIAYGVGSKSAIDGLYLSKLGRTEDPAGEAGWQANLATGTTFSNVAVDFAESAEATSTIGSLYSSLTGQVATTDEMAPYQTVLKQPWAGMQDVRNAIAASSDVIGAVSKLGATMLGGVKLSSATIQRCEQQMMQPGASLADMRATIAASPEAIAAVRNLGGSMLGGATLSSSTIQVCEQEMLAPGVNLEDTRATIAGSSEAIAAVRGYGSAMLGEVTLSADTIQQGQKALLESGANLDATRMTIALSPEAAGVVGGLYQSELGRAPDAGGLAGWQDHLGTTMTLEQVRAGIANSDEAAGDIRDLDLYASGQMPTNAAVAGEQATLSQGGSLSGLYSTAVTAVGAGFIGSPDQYNEALRQMRLPAAGVDGPLSTIGTGVRNVLEWAARKAPELGAVGAAAAVLLTPTNTQQATIEVGVAGDPDLGARYTRAPGSLNGTVTLYTRGPDGQPVGDGITLQASADGQLTGPPGSPLAGVVFGTLPPGNIFEGVQLAPGLTVALGLPPTASGTPQTAPGSGIEVRTQQEADLVASMQAQGASNQDIQAALDALRSGQGAIPISQTVNNAIQEAAGSPDQDVQLEGKTAQLIQNSGIDVISFQREIGPNASITELDIETSKAIVEVTTQSAGKLKQISARLTNPQINPENKGVILYAPNYGVPAGRDITNAGGYVARTPQQLIDLLRSLGE